MAVRVAFVVRVVLAILVLSCVSVAAFAQAPETVSVLDSSGGTVDGAIVILRRGATERRATTDADGVARFNNLEAGGWTLEVHREGFADFQQSVEIGAMPSPITVKLELPKFTQTVDVQAAGTALVDHTPRPNSASRLDLSPLELPATLNIVTQAEMQDRGADTAMQAVELAGGVLLSTGEGGQIPGYQARGFSSDSIMTDGMLQNNPAQSSRPLDSFLLDHVEVLKGPESMFSGEGSAAGTVNFVSKIPQRQLGVDSLVSVGSFGEQRVGLGITGPLSDHLWGRVDAVYANGGVYAQPSKYQTPSAAGSLQYVPNSAISVKALVRYSQDDINGYLGTPFVNGQILPQMRAINYNANNASSKGHDNFDRVDINIVLHGGWTLRNGTYDATQALDWREMESYKYDPVNNLVDISGYFSAWRRDLLVANQTQLRKDFDIHGRHVSFLVGGEIQHQRMRRADNPSNAGTVTFAVNPFDPGPIIMPLLPYNRNPDTVVQHRTGFTEAKVNLAAKWTAVLGLRAEQIPVNYGTTAGCSLTTSCNIQGVVTPGEATYHPVSGRAGLVFAPTQNMSLYASYSTSEEPAVEFVELSGCCGNETNLGLSSARQFEEGVKGIGLHGRLEGTFAVFEIQKRNLPTTIIVNDVSIPQVVGEETSQGVEASVVAKPTNTLSVTGNLALTHIFYNSFESTASGANVSLAGLSPTNTPTSIWNINASQQIGLLNIAGNVRQVGRRWMDVNNTMVLTPYTTLDAWATMRLRKNDRHNARVTLRGRNLTDKLYIATPSTNFGLVGNPRSIEVSLTANY